MKRFLAMVLVLGMAVLTLVAGPAQAADGKKTFTILHTNGMYSAFIGLGPASDYTPFTRNLLSVPP